jgi:hypothetical protein
MRSIVLPLLVSVALLSAPATAAETPAGIVMEISGQTTPPLSDMTEIPANIPFQLNSDTRLTFLHYASCKLVTVMGGTLALTRSDYKEDGKVENETDGPCPRVYSLPDTDGGHGAGGTIFRGAAMAPRWPANPQIVFTGARAHAIAAAEILADAASTTSQSPVPLSLSGMRAKQPSGATPLQPNGHYTLRLTMQDRRDPVDIPFIATVSGGGDALVVLRVD